jgi:hypothetical protein
MRNLYGRCSRMNFPFHAVALGLLLLGACGSQETEPGYPAPDATTAPVCAPGDQKACACPGGMQGAQR